MRTVDLIEDVEFMLRHGEPLWRMAERLGMTEKELCARLTRNKRSELAEQGRLNDPTYQPREGWYWIAKNFNRRKGAA